MSKIFIIILLLFSVAINTYSQKLHSTQTHVLFNVKVMDFSDAPRKNERILIEGIENQKKYTGLSNAYGIYSVLVSKGVNYQIKYKDFDNYINYSNLYVPPDSGYFTFEINVRFENKETYVLNNLNFESNKAELLKDSYETLNQLFDLLQRKPNLSIEIAGHTDNAGSYVLNMKLSQKRAEAVMNYLINKGIYKDRILATGYGDTMPISSNDTEDSRKQNRRTEIRILTE